MSDRPILFRRERDGVAATIVLDNPAKWNAWSWEPARQVTAIADEIAKNAPLAVRLGCKAMAKKEDAHFEGK